MSTIKYQCPIHGTVDIPEDTLFDDECPLCKEESGILDESYLFNDDFIEKEE